MQFFLQAPMAGKECAEGRQAQEDGERRYDDDDNDEEALSLCDLPLIRHQSTQDSEEHTTRRLQEAQEDFDFDFDFDFSCSLSQISAADEIFFQGQILPFRRCITSTNNTFPQHNSIPRSKSMNPYFSGRRSNSHHSSTTTSGSGSGSDAKQAPRNQFHSHPSPSPRIITSNSRNRVKKPWPWSVFRLGPIAAQPEIAFRDPKTRRSVKNSGGGSSSERKNKTKAREFVGGCKCSVDDTVPQEIAFMKRSASDGERPVNKPVNRRTYEWLKQLSLQGAAAAER